MSKIKKLSLHEAQKIAAGEVVDRPAHIVKELIENALDAGATTVFLYVQEGGKSLIRVVDNGTGMGPEDARLCFEQHATSKIERVDDLQKITTFGFRGEALASIAAVSRVTLVTKESEAPHGIQLHVVEGVVQDETIISCNTGTIISIADLFYNIPARKKFLKTTETEWRAIVHLFQAMSFDAPAVHFKLFHNEKCIYNCPPVSDISLRIPHLWDNSIASSMIPLVSEQNAEIVITGMLTNTHYARYDRNAIVFLVNSRWVKNHKLSNALLKGYGNSLPPGRFPAAVVSLKVDPTQVDINIHPRKEEVAFLHPRIIENALTVAVKKSLEVGISSTLKRVATSWFTEPVQPLVWPQNMHKPFSENLHKEERFSAPVFLPEQKHVQAEVHFRVGEQKIEASESRVQKNVTPAHQYTIVGQYHATYILLETEQGLVLVDQHAAHERVLYELFLKRFEDVATVSLLFPSIIHMHTENLVLLEPHLTFLKKFGIHADIFDNNQLIVTATPVHAQKVNFAEFMQQVVVWLDESASIAPEPLRVMLQEKIHAQMACKAAVKAGDALTTEHMRQLITDLYSSENRFSCPHGRPTTWELSLHEIEKKFRRKL